MDWYHVDLDRNSRYHTFPRQFISGMYGGSAQTTFPKIDQDKVAVHGIGNFSFPRLEYNPHAPKHPGAPGLHFRARVDDPPVGDHRVFVGIDAGKWLYCGTYRYVPAQPLTPQDFQDQSAKVRQRLIYSQRWLTGAPGPTHLGETHQIKEVG